MVDKCRIVPIKKEEIIIRLFDEEIEEAEFLALAYDLSYEQLFVKLVKQELNIWR